MWMQIEKTFCSSLTYLHVGSSESYRFICLFEATSLFLSQLIIPRFIGELIRSWARRGWRWGLWDMSVDAHQTMVSALIVTLPVLLQSQTQTTTQCPSPNCANEQFSQASESKAMLNNCTHWDVTFEVSATVCIVNSNRFPLFHFILPIKMFRDFIHLIRFILLFELWEEKRPINQLTDR